jgi:hypothetical protein
LGFGLGLMGIVTFLVNGEARKKMGVLFRNSPHSIIIPVLLNGLLASMLVVPYLRGNEGFERPIEEVVAGLPRWNSWFSVPPKTLWYPILEPICLGQGGEGYIGGGAVCLLLLTALIVVLRRPDSGDRERIWIRTIALTLLLFVVLSFSIWISDNAGGGLWFFIYYLVPGAKAIRVIFRIYLIFYPLLIVGGLLSLRRILSETPARRRGWLIAGLMILALAENYFPQIDDRGRSFRWAKTYEEARQISGVIRGMDAVYGYTSTDPIANQLTMMWAGLYANVPVINGYSGRHPRGYPFVGGEAASDEALRAWLGQDWRGKVMVYDIDLRRKEKVIVLGD